MSKDKQTKQMTFEERAKVVEAFAAAHGVAYHARPYELPTGHILVSRVYLQDLWAGPRPEPPAE